MKRTRTKYLLFLLLSTITSNASTSDSSCPWVLETKRKWFLTKKQALVVPDDQLSSFFYLMGSEYGREIAMQDMKKHQVPIMIHRGIRISVPTDKSKVIAHFTGAAFRLDWTRPTEGNRSYQWKVESMGSNARVTRVDLEGSGLPNGVRGPMMFLRNHPSFEVAWESHEQLVVINKPTDADGLQGLSITIAFPLDDVQISQHVRGRKILAIGVPTDNFENGLVITDEGWDFFPLTPPKNSTSDNLDVTIEDTIDVI